MTDIVSQSHEHTMQVQRDATIWLDAVLAALAKKRFMIVFRQESPIGGYQPIMGYSVSIKEVKDAE